MANNSIEVKEQKVKACDNKSVGMIICRGDKILLIERKKFPFGFAPPAGHIDDKGNFENAAREEVEEEVGFRVTGLKQIAEGRKENRCRRPGGSWHYWKIYKVEVEGKLKPSPDETKKAGWYSKEEIQRLAERTEKYLKGEVNEEDWQKSPGLETVFYDWFQKLGIISNQAVAI